MRLIRRARRRALLRYSHILGASTLAFTARQTFFARVSEVVHAASAQAGEETF